jgi:transposase
MLKSRGYDKAAYRGSWWKVLNRQWMRQRADTTDLWCVGLTNLLDELELHEKQLATITKYLDSYLEKRADAKLVMTIPGIGPRTSEAVLAYTDDIHRFSTSKRYRSYFGVVPKIDQSGNNFRMGHISKQGPSVVRWLLCESSWKAVRKSPALKAFYERICNGDVRRKKIAMVAVCRKILCIMRAMLLTGELFNELLVTKLCKEDTEAA